MAALANTTSYELTSTVQELDELRDTSGRPRLERLAVELLAKDARRAARAQDLEATLTARPIQGALDTEMGDEERSALRPMMILKVTLICWFAILRSGMFGLGAGGCAVAFQSLAKKVYKAELPDGTSRPPAWGDWHFYAYWVINGLLPTIVSFAESILIYFDLLKVSLAVAATSGIKLYPLDPVRVFVCNSIVAEVFELGHPSEPRFGINPLRGSNEYILKLYEMLYSLRGGALKFIIKVCPPCARVPNPPSLRRMSAATVQEGGDAFRAARLRLGLWRLAHDQHRRVYGRLGLGRAAARHSRCGAGADVHRPHRRRAARRAPGDCGPHGARNGHPEGG